MIEMHDKAVEDFSVVIKKNPKNAHAYFRRAFSNKALGNFSEAVDDFEKAKNLDPMNPSLVVNYKKLKGVACIVLCEPGAEKVFKWNSSNNESTEWETKIVPYGNEVPKVYLQKSTFRSTFKPPLL